MENVLTSKWLSLGKVILIGPNIDEISNYFTITWSSCFDNNFCYCNFVDGNRKTGKRLTRPVQTGFKIAVRTGL